MRRAKLRLLGDPQWMVKMRQLRLFDGAKWEIQPGERLATIPVLNSAREEVTSLVKPTGPACSRQVLANIYLHYIVDLWFEKKVKQQIRGFAQLVRYADDFIVCFQYGDEARAFGEALKQRLSKFGLRIAEEKSRIIEFGRYVWEKAQRQDQKVATFDFLGFTHYCDKTRRGKFKLGRRTARSKFRQKMKAMNQWLKGVRNAVELKA